MKITLPRDIRVDIDNVPQNLEEIVQMAFEEFTRGTSPEYMYKDKLYFIDLMVRRLHRADPTTKVKDHIKETFGYRLDEYGELMEPYEFLDTPFMESCYKLGDEDGKLYSYYFAEDYHDGEKIMKIECRVIKAVMDYPEEGGRP